MRLYSIFGTSFTRMGTSFWAYIKERVQRLSSSPRSRLSKFLRICQAPPFVLILGFAAEADIHLRIVFATICSRFLNGKCNKGSSVNSTPGAVPFGELQS